MPQSDPNTGVRYAIGGDAPSLPVHTKNIVDDIRKKIIPNFASIAARDLAITGAPPVGPTIGQMVTVGDQAYIRKAVGGWRKVLDDAGSDWVPLVAAPNFGTTFSCAARVVAGWVELRGIMRHSSAVGTDFVQLTASGNSAVAQVAAAYSTAGTGGVTATLGGLNSSFAPTTARLAITARTNGALYIAAAQTGVAQGADTNVLYFNLADVRFPTG